MSYIKFFFYRFAYYSGFISLFFFLNRNKQLIINYHHILPKNEIDSNICFGFTHTIEAFKTHLDVIKKRFAISTEFNYPKSLLITFDDGALNNYKYAYPILKEKNIKCVFFLIDDQIQSSKLNWCDFWFIWFSIIPFGIYNINGIELSFKCEQDRPANFHLLWSVLMNNYSEKDKFEEDMHKFINSEIIQNYVSTYKSRFHSMSITQINEMKNDGHLFGYHSKSHDMLNRINTDRLISDENITVKKTIYDSSAFAIPFGTEQYFSKNVLEILIGLGYTPILLNQSFYNESNESILCRLNLPNTTDLYEIEAYLSGFKLFLDKLRIKFIHLFKY